MRYPEGHREQTREHILDVATNALRERGIDGVGLREVMKRAGLATKGGFYAHFRSREHLVAEAMGRAIKSSRDIVAGVLLGAEPRDWLETAALVYLSRGHRDDTAGGCPVAALGPELARSIGETREVVNREMSAYIDVFAERLGDRRRAIGAMATLIGGLQLARTVDDNELVGEILEAARTFTITAAQEPNE